MPSDEARPGWRKCSSKLSPHKIHLVRAIRNAIATAMATIWDAGTDPLGVVRIASDPHKKTAPAPIRVSRRRISELYAAFAMRRY